MAQHDYDIANGTGAAVRADINAALTAVLTSNSGTAEPSTRQAYMLWADTTAGLLKIRNAANNAWITIGSLSLANLGLTLATGGSTFHALGTAALPSYSFSGDANTGFWSPAGDIVALSLNGAERARWDAAGYFKARTVASYYGGASHELIANDAAVPGVILANNNATFASAAVQVYAVRNTTNKTFRAIDYYNTTGGDARFIVYDNGQVLSKGSYDQTTASAANVFIDATGLISRSTSSRIYKTDINPIADDTADAVLALEPVRYRSLSENDNSKWSYYGLIAEDVAAVDPRLVHWGYRDDDYETIVTEEQSYNDETREVITKEVKKRQLKDGAELRPEGVQYDRLPVLMLEVIKRHEAAINELKAKIAALE